NVLLSCLRLLFIMGRKGGFSCPGGEQKLLMELFYEINSVSTHLPITRLLVGPKKEGISKTMRYPFSMTVYAH
ncbi:hypothetical protein P4518_14090, partial [Geobacillus thermodenitrificans]|uniref:hypothetical protein n=1 Tax=Geobacillus thermodenitrificans TaxID=33940 RepID=UPI002E1BD33B|nr:hypothetical protein [Geobacillus thermodenitrificans]